MLVAGGGPTTPDRRVLRAMTLPVIGQFDPAFTQVMDEVMQLARQTFLTRNRACFAVSAPRHAGLAAVLNSLPDKTPVQVASGTGVADLRALAAHCHGRGELLVVDATEALGAREIRVDDWNVDVCIAGTDHALGGPAGLCLITYSDAVEARMRSRSVPPSSSYLDLLQLQAYWSPERLNHHTAPTSLIYGLREALRLLLEETLETRWARHQRVFNVLASGLDALNVKYRAEPPTFVVDLGIDASDARRRLREDFGVEVARPIGQSVRLGLVGANACVPQARRLLGALQSVVAGAR
ncbi:MAG: alanine--glyoxylate aminotransferase family protein [Chloroflexi bacterium]|nr:alanine--glyoxylate aminotransferase family protein [Chloroflexota bacterium]